MSKFLCTFSGKFGDILWSLPTARFIAEQVVGEPVDFAVMPYYQSLLPLLAEQSYIENAFVIEDWLRTHSNHGDQPWEPPAQPQYERQWHLTYKGHPGISAPSMPLVDFIAFQQGISLRDTGVRPFLQVDDPKVEEEAFKLQFNERSMAQVLKERRLVTYSFNEQYAEPKKEFFETLWKRLQEDSDISVFDVSTVGWKEAAWLIKESLVYVGCRSACWVLANGVGKKQITFEPHPSRHKSCHLGQVFGNPYGTEIALPFGMQSAIAAGVAGALIEQFRKDQLEIDRQCNFDIEDGLTG